MNDNQNPSGADIDGALLAMAGNIKTEEGEQQQQSFTNEDRSALNSIKTSIIQLDEQYNNFKTILENIGKNYSRANSGGNLADIITKFEQESEKNRILLEKVHNIENSLNQSKSDADMVETKKSLESIFDSKFSGLFDYIQSMNSLISNQSEIIASQRDTIQQINNENKQIIAGVEGFGKKIDEIEQKMQNNNLSANLTPQKTDGFVGLEKFEKLEVVIEDMGVLNRMIFILLALSIIIILFFGIFK